MDYIDRMDNIYLIDTKMFGFEYYMSAYLVVGKEIALVDTGVPTSWEALCTGIRAHGFDLDDISYVFVTHEHPDHIGNVAKILQESPKANVYMNPVGEQAFIDWSDSKKKQSDQFAKRYGLIEPTPSSRVRHLDNGDLFDLGDNEVLEVIFTPGHQPGGITLFDHRNNGLFINDLIGNYFPDADAHLILLPAGSDIKQQIASMSKLMSLQVKNLYLGHFGIINDTAMDLLAKTLNKMQQVLEIGETCMRMNKANLIGTKLSELVKPYMEKMRRIRGEKVYEYIIQLHLPFLIESYTRYCQERLGNRQYI